MAKTPTRDDLATMHLANPAQIELMDREIANNRGALQGKSMFIDNAEMAGQDMRTWGNNFQSPDPAILREAIRRDEETKAKGLPPDYTGYQKNAIYKLVQEAEARILDGMPTQEQMQQGTHGNVEHFIAHQEYTQVDQQVYLNGMRILYPANEGLSIESLRGYQGGVKSRKPWERGIEKVTWTEREELEESLATLDDSVYLHFMELVAMGITTPKLIQRDLGVSQKVYEACKARMEQAKAQRQPLGEPEPDEAFPSLAPPQPEPAPPVDGTYSPLARRLVSALRKSDLTLDHAALVRTAYTSKAKVAEALDELRASDDPIILRWDRIQRAAEPQSAAS